jgi:hypothetical protein
MAKDIGWWRRLPLWTGGVRDMPGGLLDFINGYQPAVGAGAWPQQLPQQGLLNNEDAAAAQAAQDAAGQQLQRLMGRRSLSGPGVPFLPSDASMSGMLNGYSAPQPSPAATVASSPDVMAPTTQQGGANMPLPRVRPAEAPGDSVAGGGDTTPAQAPMSLAPPTPPSSPNVPDTSLAGRLGLSDRLGAAFHGFANSPGRGLLGHLSAAATGFETGQRQDQPGLALQSRQALYQAARQANATPEQALAYSLNPQSTEGILPKTGQVDEFGTQVPTVTNRFTGATSRAPTGLPPQLANQPPAAQRQLAVQFEGTQGTDKATGKAVIVRNGRWVYMIDGKPVPGQR